MGKGTIISGGTDGQYQVSIVYNTDYADVEKDANLAKISHIEAKIAEEDEEQEIDILNLQKLALEKRNTMIDAIQGSEDVSAWCADRTEGLSGDVGIIEVPGESVNFNIQPGIEGNATYDPARDGQLTPTMSMPASAAFYNIAMLPGWQKWKPTYRYATIDSINTDMDVADITMLPASSTQQGLGVNAESSYTGVTIEYMTCDAAAFDEGDIVLVQFVGQDKDNPKIIGFRDNPKPCYGGLSIYGDNVTLRYTGADYIMNDFYLAGYNTTWIGANNEVVSYRGRLRNHRLIDSTDDFYPSFYCNGRIYNVNGYVSGAIKYENKLLYVIASGVNDNDPLTENWYFMDLDDLDNPRLAHTETYEDCVYPTIAGILFTSAWVFNESGTEGLSLKSIQYEPGTQNLDARRENHIVNINPGSETISISNANSSLPTKKRVLNRTASYSYNETSETGSFSYDTTGNATYYYFYDYVGDEMVTMEVKKYGGYAVSGTIDNTYAGTHDLGGSHKQANLIENEGRTQVTGEQGVSYIVDGEIKTISSEEYYSYESRWELGSPSIYKSVINTYSRQVSPWTDYGPCAIDPRFGVFVEYGYKSATKTGWTTVDYTWTWTDGPQYGVEPTYSGIDTRYKGVMIFPDNEFLTHNPSGEESDSQGYGGYNGEYLVTKWESEAKWMSENPEHNTGTFYVGDQYYNVTRDIVTLVTVSDPLWCSSNEDKKAYLQPTNKPRSSGGFDDYVLLTSATISSGDLVDDGNNKIFFSNNLSVQIMLDNVVSKSKMNRS